MTIEEMIAVLQAYEDGKTIEVKSLTEWEITSTPLWDFCRNDYRVKPEPREFYIDLNPNGSVQCAYTINEKRVGSSLASSESIKVREVLED